MTATQVRRAFDERTVMYDQINEANVEPDAYDLFLKLRAAWSGWYEGHLFPIEWPNAMPNVVRGGTAAKVLGFGVVKP